MKSLIPPAKLHRFNIGEYYQLGELGILDQRTELIEGIIINMEPIGPWHASIVDTLNQAFAEQARNRFRVRVQQPIDLRPQSQPQPDIVLCRPVLYRDRHPEPADIFLVVEVADTTLDLDLGQKRDLYAAARVPEYWVIDVQGKKLTRFAREGADLAECPVPGAKLSSATLPDVTIDLTALFE
jgi:Uma2 family endonuclease